MDFATAVYFMIVTMSTVGCVCDMAFFSHTGGHTDRLTD